MWTTTRRRWRVVWWRSGSMETQPRWVLI
uniref:Uncharacterized protein n=1 Tax=Arundo donax TaxID=35708 RepID=A0A0A9A8E4_ARUDO